jgi:hypothetical protein
MNTSPAPDVDRVLHRMGRSAFDYRSFPNPVDEAVPSAPGAADAPEDAPPARTFSLVGEALPEAYGADAVPFAPAPAPAPAPMPTLLAAAMPPANPGAPMAPAPAPRATPLSHMFRILSGLAPAAPSWCDADRQDTGFPFRRR